MSESASDRGLKLPIFDGEAKKFQMWWTRFNAYASVYKFRQAIQENGDEDLPESFKEVFDEETPEGKKKMAAIKRNEIAMASFTMAFTTETLMGLVYKASNVDWPSGLTKLVVQGLLQKYRPLDSVSKVEMYIRMSQVNMKKGADPSTLFDQIHAIDNQFVVDQSNLIAAVMHAATEDYHSIISTERRIRGEGKMTLAHLEEAMRDHYRHMSSALKRPGQSRGQEPEVVLSAFGGICYNCKKQGHRANKCPDKAEANEGDGTRKTRFQGKCNNCGKVGHREADCWEKQENQAKRPSGYKTASQRGNGSEKAASAVDWKNKTEFLMGALTFPEEQGLLEDPNVWIADTAATVHMTPHKNGISMVRTATGADAITMGNGHQEQASQIANIVGTMCDKFGNEIGTATMTDVDRKSVV